MCRLIIGIILILFSFSGDLSAQNNLNRTCNTLELHYEKMQDPKYRASFQEKLKRSAIAMKEGRDLCANPVVLPMAVHFSGIPTPSESDKDCLTALALDQIQILNDDYHGTNADISNWTAASSNYPGVSNGETCISFCLATQNHPAGFNLNNGDYAITYNQVTGDFSSAWSGYINIWVKNIGALGYSPLGGNGNGDGVAIDIEAFGAGSGCSAVNVVPGSPYHLGRTLTHELGHYLLLNHIWGGGCGSDDGIADTPNASGPNYGCPSATASSCSSIDMHMNYMDYTNDACMYMFSAGQSTVMENYTSADLTALIANADLVCKNSITFVNTSQSIQEGSEHCSMMPSTLITLELQIGGPPDEDVIVSLEIDPASSATQFEDYGSIPTTIIFPNGSGANQSFSFPVYHDPQIEPDESIIVNIIDVNGGGILQGISNQTFSLLIVNDDFAPSTGGNTIFINEGFENNAPGWQVIDGGSTTDTWYFPDSYSGNNIDGSAFAFVDSDASGNGSTNFEQLLSPVFNASSATSLTLSFQHYFNAYPQGYLEQIDVDVFDGNSWQNVFSASGNADIGSWNNPVAETIDILPYANSNMRLRFQYDGEYDWYWAVDNVMVEGFTITNVQTGVNSVSDYAEHEIGPFETVHFYDLSSGDIMLSIENMSSHDFGCTKVEVLTEGTGVTPSIDPSFSDITDKTFQVTPEFNSTADPYLITLYYTTEELDGWIANNTQGHTLNELLMIKSPDPVIGSTNIQSAVFTANAFGSDWSFEALYNSGFSGFGLSNNGLLPVELISFEGQAFNEYNLLEWSLASQEDNRGFHIMKSEEGKSFDSIGWIESNGKMQYEFKDYNLNSKGSYYYLLQEDIDGKQNGSETIFLQSAERITDLICFPNPANDMLYIGGLAKNSNIEVHIINSFGKKLEFKMNDNHSIDVSKLNPGIYYIQVLELEHLTGILRFIKQK